MIEFNIFLCARSNLIEIDLNCSRARSNSIEIDLSCGTHDLDGGAIIAKLLSVTAQHV
jgi:hypothetical protein